MPNDREEWSATANLLDGRRVSCRFIPQKAGASMAIFQVQAGQIQIDQGLREAV